MNGWQFLNKMEELGRDKNIFVIMVTSSIDRYDKEIAENYKSVIGFIEKPITTENCLQIKDLTQLAEFFKVL